MVISHINGLERCGLIVKDQTFGLSVASTGLGKLMARYYISFETIKVFRQVQGNESFLDIFNTIIRSREFSDFTLRVNDKKVLNAINNHPIRFPIKGKVKTNENKISCLIQAVFDNITIQDSSMMQDALRMIRVGEKLSKCLAEYIRLSEGYLCGKVYKAFSSALIIAKCYRAKLWNNTQFVSKQLKSIGPVYSTHLVNAGKTTIQSLLETDARKIEMILGKAPPFGDQLLDALSSFPSYSMEFVRKTQNFLQITIEQTNDRFCYDGKNARLVVGDASNNLLFYHAKVDQTICEEKKFERTFPIKDENTNFVQARLIHEYLVGVDQDEKIILNPDEELPEPKRKKQKVQTKIKLKPSKKTLITECSKHELHKSLMEGDDIFQEIDVKEIESINNVDKTKKTAETNQDICGEPIKSFKRFEYIPAAKVYHTSQGTNHPEDVLPALGECTNKNLLDPNSSQIIEIPTDSMDEIYFDAASDHQLIEELLQHNIQLEEDFIRSQILKQAEVQNGKITCSNIVDNEPLDLRIISKISQHSQAQQKSAPILLGEKKDNFKNEINAIMQKPLYNLETSVSIDSFDNNNQKVINNSKTPMISTSIFKSCNTVLKANSEMTREASPRKISTNSSLTKAFFSRENSDISSFRIDKKTPTNEFKKRPNLSKLKNYSFRFTPLPKKASSSSFHLMNGSRSCSVPKYKNSMNSGASLSQDFQSNGKTKLCDHFNNKSAKMKQHSKAGLDVQTENKRSTNLMDSDSSSIFSMINRCQKISKHVVGDNILSQICESYVPTINRNDEPKTMLRKLEQELNCESESVEIKENFGRSQFFQEINSREIPPPSTTNDIKIHAEKIFQFRSSFPQPTFQKILHLKPEPAQQPQAFNQRPVLNSSNPENDRIDQILHNVVREPIQQLSAAISNPYRMKLPRRHKNMNPQYPSRQNFEYFENMRRKSELEKLNNTFKAPNERNEAYMSQMSKILFADLKKSKFPPVPNFINTAGLPKPDFDVIDKGNIKKSVQNGIRDTSEDFSYTPVCNIVENDFESENNLFHGMFAKPKINYSETDLSHFFKPGITLDDDQQNSEFSNFENDFPNIGATKPIEVSCSSSDAYKPGTSKIQNLIGFESPGTFKSIDFEDFRSNTGVKEEPLSPCFEALSLLDDNDGEDALLSQIKMEPTQRFSEGIIDLTSPFSRDNYKPYQLNEPFLTNMEGEACINP